MVSKIRSCVFISGNGSNLKSIIKSSRDYNFPIKIELIISNNIKAKGLEFAKKYGISFKFLAYDNQKKFERNCLFEIKKRKIKFLCLAGFMKILSSNFVRTFHHKIINIHPSLLPKYKGINTHKRVLKSKERYSGCTIEGELGDAAYLITSGLVDILIDKSETESSLRAKILKQEHKLYSQSIISIFK